MEHVIMKWECVPGGLDYLGFIPSFLSANDPRPAREQFDDNYAHGGGWRPMPEWRMSGNNIQYPGDPMLKPVAWVQLRDEKILVYPHAFVCIRQADGSFEVARLD